MAVNVFHKHFHHKHKKRSTKKEPIDVLVYLAVFAGPLFTIPQVYLAWTEESQGVSTYSWIAYTVIAMIWLIYGIKHKEIPIIISQILWLLMDILIVVGLLLQNT